ncbi:MAG: hypothetical protein RL521_523 [Bacteroidota bacterium]
MNKFHLLIGMILLSITLTQCSACKEPQEPEGSKDATYIVHWITRFGENDLVQGQTYRDAFNRRLLLEDLRGYVSDVKLIDENDSAIVLKDFSLLNWFSDPTISVAGRPAKIKALQFSLGIPSAYNTAVDPTTYPNSHPLSVAGAAGMFWTWNTGYIFYQLNGKCDLSGSENQPMIDPIAYHCGDDTLYRTITFDITDFTLKAGEAYQINIDFDAQRCFWNESDTMDLDTDYLTHTAGNLPLAMRAMDLYQSAFSIP